MIASVDTKFVLLCNPKTGTTSLEEAFGPYADIRVGGSPRWKHINYAALRKIFGNYFEKMDCKIYAVVRDPIDSLVSWYKYRSREELKNPKHPNHRNYTGNIDFPEFLASWSSDSPPPFASVSSPVNWCLDRDGKIAPISFFRYENIDRLTDTLADHVGHRPVLKRLNASPSISVEIDREAISRIPKMRRQLQLYEDIPFVE